MGEGREKFSRVDDKRNLPSWAKSASEAFKAAMDNDLHIPGAMAALFDMVHEGNKALDAGVGPVESSNVRDVLTDFDRVLGFLRKESQAAAKEVMKLVDEREKARKSGNWRQSDGIREKLIELGWEVRDTRGGPHVIRRREK